MRDHRGKISADTGDGLRLRERSVSNLKQIAVAMYNYQVTHGHYPPAALTDAAGEPLLSWRVAILPYLARQELYDRFKLDEPWDGPANRELLSEMPEVYTLAGVDFGRRHETFYRGFHGPGAFFEGTQGIEMMDITDGPDTLMVVEAADPVAWTKPDELTLTNGSPLPEVGGQFKEGFHALTCDGEVLFLDRGIDADLLRWAITRNDGQVMTLARLRYRSWRDERPSGIRLFLPPNT